MMRGGELPLPVRKSLFANCVPVVAEQMEQFSRHQAVQSEWLLIYVVGVGGFLFEFCKGRGYVISVDTARKSLKLPHRVSDQVRSRGLRPNK